MIRLLAVHMALSPGANIWFVPDIRTSSWTRELDWYLGFQIFHAQSFQAKPIPEMLQKIMAENGVPEVKVRPSNTPILAMAVEGDLPTQNLVVVSAPEPNEWLESCEQIWKKAKKPSVRLFLPSPLTPLQVEQFWGKSDDLSVVLSR